MTARRQFLVVKGLVVGRGLQQSKGFLSVLMDRINSEITALERFALCSDSLRFQARFGCRMESTWMFRHHDDSPSLSGLVNLLTNLIKDDAIRAKFKRDNLAQPALSAYLRVRVCLLCVSSQLSRTDVQGLQLQQSDSTLDCADKLLKVVTSVFSSSDDDKRATIRAYVQALSQSLNDKRSVIFILESLCNLIKPPKPQRHCQDMLRKVPFCASLSMSSSLWFACAVQDAGRLHSRHDDQESLLERRL